MCIKLKTIEFDINSKLKIINNEAFLSCPSIEKIILPSSVEILKDGWINSTNINDVQIIGNSRNLKIENKIIFGKTDVKDDLYDIIYFVVQDIYILFLLMKIYMIYTILFLLMTMLFIFVQKL